MKIEKNDQQKEDNKTKMIYSALATTEYELSCPECGKDLERSGRCLTCMNCGWSTCGV